MTTAVTSRPAPTEHAPYYGKYIALVTENDAIAGLESQLGDALPLLRGIPESKGEHRYAPGKWTIKEVIGHLIDTERVFSYRALRFARKDETPLPGFEENDYVPAGNFGARSLAQLIDELEIVRKASLLLFHSLDAAAWNRSGVASDNLMSVRALAFVIAGHGRHHVEILKTRYL